MFHIFVANFDRPLCEQSKGNPKVILTPADKLKKVKNGLLSYFQILAKIIPHIVSSMRQQKMYIQYNFFWLELANFQFSEAPLQNV